MSDFSTGVNLGGWLSQYREASSSHFESFIQEADIERIAGWDMDHVRLPVDYPVIEDPDRPGSLLESGIAHVDRLLTWCRKYDLQVVLDLHRAPGYSFATLDQNTLFDREADQERFCALWQSLARRYRAWGEDLRFELMNEVVEANSDRWNRLAHRAIAAIREVDRTRVVVYGGNRYNAIDELAHIDRLEDDPYIVYTFHFYHPHLFTHQRAGWDELTRLYDREVTYPGSFPGLEAFRDAHPQFASRLQGLPGRADRAYMERLFEPARAFLRASERPLYCGEYGVIENAPMRSRVAWHRDVCQILRALGIGRAVWSYKAMHFGLVDHAGRVVSDELVRVVSGL